MVPTGRFAPSPTGEIHFGSLVAAVASFLQARSDGGRWLIRIEDIDPPREVPGSAGRILQDLLEFGLQSDLPVLYQSQRTDAYRNTISELLESGDAFWCSCSRANIPASGVYPGTCRGGLSRDKAPRSVRLKVHDIPIRFNDLVQGQIEENLAETVGDFVIWRADDLPAYQLAVVVDDACQHVTEVVRGVDLLSSTARQIHLLNRMKFPVPRYAHHPVAVDANGCKLSKRLGSDPISLLSRAEALEQVLRFLGQPCPPGLSLKKLWAWALNNWRLSRIPGLEQISLDSGA